MKLKYIFLLFVIFYLWACLGSQKSAGSPAAILKDTVAIHFQESYGFDKENIQVTFDSLLEDSRCPVNVVCIWAGNAKVLLTLTKDSYKQDFILNTNKRFNRDTVLFGYTISLKNVWPLPHTDSLYTLQDYSIDMIISKP